MVLRERPKARDTGPASHESDMNRGISPSDESSLIDTLLQIDKEVSWKLSIYYLFDNNPTLQALLKTLCVILEFSGHGLPWIIAAVLCLSVVNTKEEFHLNLLSSLLFDLAVIGISKLVAKRQRPAYNKVAMLGTVSIDRYSFPSGHTSRAFMLLVLLWGYFDSTFYSMTLIAWAVSLAYSRIFVGRHYLTDVLFGSLLGLWEAYFMMRYFWVRLETYESLKLFVKQRTLGTAV